MLWSVAECYRVRATNGATGAMGYGDGSFREWKDGGYQYRKYFSSPVDGNKKHRLVVYGKTKRECRDKMDAKQREYEKTLREAAKAEEKPQSFLSDAMLSWLKAAKLGKIKATAYDRLEGVLNNQIAAYSIGKTSVELVDAKCVSDHLYCLQYADDYSFSTTKKVYELLDQFFMYYYANDLNANPMNKVDRPQPTRNVGELSADDLTAEAALPDIVLSDDEIRRFKAQVFEEPRHGSRGHSRYGVAFYFIMMTCLRFGEAAALTWRDVNFEKREIIINKTASRVKDRTGSAQKTRRIITTPKNSKTRVVMLSKEAVEALETIRARSGYIRPADLVIATSNGTMVLHNEFWLRLKGTLKAAGLLTEARATKFTPHYLRHTGISYYIRNGIPLEMVSQMAGHSSTAITERVYYHVIQDQRKKMVELMDGIGAKKGH